MQTNEQDPNEEEPALEFWTAYLPYGTQKHYLSNGKGGVRLVKDRALLEEWLQRKLSAEEFARVVIHAVAANFVIPEPEPEPKPTPMPIQTLYPATLPPSAEDLLESWNRNRSRKRHKPKGK